MANASMEDLAKFFRFYRCHASLYSPSLVIPVTVWFIHRQTISFVKTPFILSKFLCFYQDGPKDFHNNIPNEIPLKKAISTVLNISLLFRFSSLPLACGFSAAPSTQSFMASWTATSDLSTRECSMISLVLLVLRERSRQVKAKICPAREIIQHESIQIFKKKAFIFPWVSLCRSAQVNLS